MSRVQVELDWMRRAACRNRPTSWWFALPRTPEADLAASICAECPVVEPCTAAGRAAGEFGRWGVHAKLLDKYRKPPPVETVVFAKESRDGLWRCRDCWDLPFFSEHALLVHLSVRHSERRAG